MEYFTTALRHGNIAKAAAELNIAASAVSVAIDQVEAEFDLTLVTRQRVRGIQANTSGRDVARKCERLLEEYRSMLAEGGELKHALAGTLRIGYYAPIAPAFLPQILDGFLPGDTALTLELEECDNDQAQERIVISKGIFGKSWGSTGGEAGGKRRRGGLVGRHERGVEGESARNRGSRARECAVGGSGGGWQGAAEPSGRPRGIPRRGRCQRWRTCCGGARAGVMAGGTVGMSSSSRMRSMSALAVMEPLMRSRSEHRGQAWMSTLNTRLRSWW